jgi:hypothetical protein
MDKTGRNARNFVVDALQLRQKLLNAEVAQGVTALKRSQVQGHSGGLGSEA